MQCIEIGCFEGYGTHKIHELFCSHAESRITCIDPWDDVYVKDKLEFADIDPIFANQYSTFVNNTHSIIDKLDVRRGYSNDVLIQLDNNTYDFAYVDGDHSADQVCQDGRLLFPLMKQHGIILFDDYNWSHGTEITQVGIERFIFEFQNKIDVLFRGPIQCAIRIK